MKRTALFVVFVLFASLAHAGIFKGSLGANGNKFYTFTASGAGILEITVIADNAASNVNVGLGLSSGTLLCASVSTIKQMEKLECGIQAGSFNILVQNYSGPSTPYRIYIGYSLNTIGTAKPMDVSKQPISPEALQRMVGQLRTLAQAK
jgi:hypothetical protein